MLRTTFTSSGITPPTILKKRSAPSQFTMPSQQEESSSLEGTDQEKQASDAANHDVSPQSVASPRRRSSVHPLLDVPAAIKSPTTVAGAIEALAVLEMHVVEKHSRDEAEERQRRISSVKYSQFQNQFCIVHLSIPDNLAVKMRLSELLRNLGTFALLFGRGVIETAIDSLMSLSRDYRYIAQVLTTEKQLHKELITSAEDETQLRSSIRVHRKSILQRRCVETAKMLRQDESFAQLHRYIEAGDDNGSIVNIARHKSDSLSTQIPTPRSFVKKKRDHMLIRLIQALYYVLLSRSELICYFMIVLNQMHSASVLSMPLPLMTLLWGTLTVPRPSQNFWITMITYTQVSSRMLESVSAMVVIKYIFQFGFFPWNKITASVAPFWLPRIIGIEKKDKYAAWDLAVLMALFFHRNILKVLHLPFIVHHFSCSMLIIAIL
ncbi:unnamed protein product, partial [Anisakis simplex]